MGAFLRAQWRWAAAAPLLVLLGAVMHEGLHAAATVALGGTLTHLELFPALGPTGLRFGLTGYRDLDESAERWVALAPFLGAHVHALYGLLLSARAPATVGKALFLVAMLPLFDLSMLHAGLFSHAASADLGRFTAEPWPFVVLGWPLFAGLCALAWRAFRAQWSQAPTLRGEEFAALLGLVLALPWLRFVTGLTR